MPNHVIVSTLGWSKQSLEAALAGIAALEFGQADLALHEGWAHINPSQLANGGERECERQAQRVEREIERLQMKRVSAFNVGLRAADAGERRRQMESVCALAERLHVPVITLGAPRRGTARQEAAGIIRPLVEVARDRGVQLTVETHVNQVTELPADAVALCEAISGLGLTLDASHLYAGPNEGADFSAVYPFVRHVHLRDAGSDTEHLQVPAGTGRVDFAAIVTALHRLGYEGKFAIEYIDRMAPAAREDAGSQAERAIPENILRMRDLFVGLERAAGIVRAAPAPSAAG